MNGHVVVFTTSEGAVERRFVPNDGALGVALKSPYLISAGQYMRFSVSVEDRPDDVGVFLEDGRELPYCVDMFWNQVPQTWDYEQIPTTRSLYEILGDAVAHGEANLSHGASCACMDNLVREVRQHIRRALPPVRRIDLDLDDVEPGEPTYQDDPIDRQRNFEARMRIAHILELARRNL